MEGFLPLSRALLGWDWHSEPKTAWLYVVMLMQANWEDTLWRGETLRRGQLLTGRKKLADASGLTEREVRTALEHLKKSGDVEVTSKNKFSIITLLRYDEHCPPDQRIVQQPTSKTSDERPADDQQPTSSRPADDHIQKVKNLKTLKKAAASAPAREDCGSVSADAYNSPERNAIEQLWQAMGNRLTTTDLVRIDELTADFEPGDILDAMREADEHGAKSSWAYIKTVLRSWKQNGGRRERPQRQEEVDPYAGLPVFGSW